MSCNTVEFDHPVFRHRNVLTRGLRTSVTVLVICVTASAITWAQYDTLFKHVGPVKRQPSHIHVNGDTVLIFHSREELEISTIVYRSFDQGYTWDSTTINGIYPTRSGPALNNVVIGNYDHDLSTPLIYSGGDTVETLDASTSVLELEYGAVEIRPHPTLRDMFMLRGMKQISQSGWSERLYIRTPGGDGWRLLNLPVPTSEARSEIRFEWDHRRPERFWIQIEVRDFRNKDTIIKWVTTDTGATFRPYAGPLPAWAGIAGPDVGFYWIYKDSRWQINTINLSTGTTTPLDWADKIYQHITTERGLKEGQAFIQYWPEGNYDSRNNYASIDPTSPNRLVFTVRITGDTIGRTFLTTRVATKDNGSTWHTLHDPWRTTSAFDTIYSAPLPALLRNGTALIPYAKRLYDPSGIYPFLESAVLRASTALSTTERGTEAPYLFITPNPASHDATIHLPTDMHAGTISMTSITGEVVWNAPILEGAEAHVVPAYAFAPGLYVITITNAQTRHVGTLHIIR